MYGDGSPSFSTVKAWAIEFKRDRTRIYDDERLGRLKTATNEEIVDIVHRIVMDNRRLTLFEISNIAGISSECMHTILHKELVIKN